MVWLTSDYRGLVLVALFIGGAIGGTVGFVRDVWQNGL